MWPLAKKLLALLVGTAVMRLIGLVTTLFNARSLGPDRFGAFSFAFTTFVGSQPGFRKPSRASGVPAAYKMPRR